MACLDYVLVPTRIVRSIRSAAVLHRSRLVRSDHRTVVMTFKLRIRTFRRIPSPFHLFDFSRLADPNVREQFEQALTQRLSAAPPDAEDPSGFSTLKNAIHQVASTLLPKERPPLNLQSEIIHPLLLAAALPRS
jgi:hypothetical protein